MKSLIIILAFLFVHSTYGETTVAPVKTCEDYLPAKTCENFKTVIASLKESATILQDAIQAAVAKHKTNAAEMIAFVKEYIAEHITCEKVLSADKCTVLNLVATRLKITTLAVKMSIEQAVEQGKTTATAIYNQALEIMKGSIKCEQIFGDRACKNIESAMDKFHEQRSLLKEAIMSVALKNYNNTKDMLQAVKEYIISKVVNFKCENFLPAARCQTLTDLAKRLKLVPAQVKEAIEMAIVNGAGTGIGTYQAAIEFLTTKITCDNILTPTACKNLLDATQKLHEQRQLIQEAIMAAAQKHITNTIDIYNEVKSTIIEKVKNFNCTDVLPESQCTLLNKIAQRFKVRSGEVTRVIVQAIVNGTSSAQKIYQVTIGKLIEDAKDLKCKDLTNVKVCAVLDNFAEKLNVNIDLVTMAVKEAIVKGKTTYSEIIAFAKQIIVDDASCQSFFGTNLVSRVICKSLQLTAYLKGITFDVVVAKLRDLYASGITSIQVLQDKIRKFINENSTYKRSIEASDGVSTKDELVDLVMQIIGGITRMAGETKKIVKAELKRLYDLGKLKKDNLMEVAKKILNDYTIFGDEQEDEEDMDLNEMKEKLRLFKEKMKEEMKKKFQLLKEKYEEFMKGILNKGQSDVMLKDFEDLSEQSMEEEFNKVLRNIL